MQGYIEVRLKIPNKCSECEMIGTNYSPDNYGEYYCKLGNNTENVRMKYIDSDVNKDGRPDWCPIKIDTEQFEKCKNTIKSENIKQVNIDFKDPDFCRQCEFFLQEDVTPWHGDVFDHPSYKTFCTKNGGKKSLIYPSGQCRRCIEKNNNKVQGE